MVTSREQTPPNRDLTVDGALDILRAPIRREIIRELRDSPYASREELAYSIADTIGRDVGEVEIALSHGHLPQLIAYDVLDERDGHIARGRWFGFVHRYLVAIERVSRDG